MKIEKIYAILFITLFALAIAPFAFAEDSTVLVSIGVDDESPVSDVQLAETLRSELELEYPIFLFSEADATTIDEVLVIAIYNNEAIIIVGEDSPVEQVAYAMNVQNIFNNLGVNSYTILSDTITSPDFKDLFETSEEPDTTCEGYGLCDAFADGTIDNLDYEWILEYVVGNYEFCGNQQNEDYCDVDRDGVVTAYDAALVLNYVKEPIPECTAEGDITNCGNPVNVVPVVVEVTDAEIKPFYNPHGIEMRFLQLEKAITRAIEGQKKIVNYIEEKYPEQDTTKLVDITEKLSEVLGKTQSVDYEADKDTLIDAFQTLKVESKESIKLFREVAHEILLEDDLKELRKRIKDIKSEKIGSLQKRIKTKIQKYNAEKVKEVFVDAGINNPKLIAAVEAGTVNYGEVRSAVAKKFKGLDNKAKKEIALKIRESKTRIEVQKDAVVQRLKKSNMTAVKEKIRAELGLVNVVARHRLSAQGVNAE